MKKIIKYLTVILFVACSSEKQEVQKLEYNLGFSLPIPYKVLSVKKESIGTDFSTKLEIEFESSSFEILSRKIVDSQLFNSDYSAKTADSLRAILISKNIKGFWVSQGDDFKFIYLNIPAEPITCVINKKSRKMAYVFSHI